MIFQPELGIPQNFGGNKSMRSKVFKERNLGMSPFYSTNKKCLSFTLS